MDKMFKYCVSIKKDTHYQYQVPVPVPIPIPIPIPKKKKKKKKKKINIIFIVNFRYIRKGLAFSVSEIKKKLRKKSSTKGYEFEVYILRI